MNDLLTELFICLFRGLDENFEMIIYSDIPATSNSQRTVVLNMKLSNITWVHADLLIWSQQHA